MRLIEVRIDPGLDERQLSPLKKRVSERHPDVTFRVVTSATVRTQSEGLRGRWAIQLASLERKVGGSNEPGAACADRKDPRADQVVMPDLVISFQAESERPLAPACPHIVVSWPGRGGPATLGMRAVHDKAATCELLVSVHESGGALVHGRRIAVPTQLTFAATHDLALGRAIAFAGMYAERLLSGERLPQLDEHQAAACRLSPGPRKTASLLGYAREMTPRVAGKVARKLGGLERTWSLRLSRGDWPAHLRDGGRAIANPPGRWWADPFLWHRDGRDYLFVEDYDCAAGRGHLSALEIDAHGRVSEVGPCLREDFHLSFPFLFEWEGQLYMCPETYGVGQIRVYRCDQFPLKWTLHAVLMDQLSAADTMLFERDGRWWMLTNIDSSGGGEHCTELHAFWSDSPLSKHWTPHEGNPLLTDALRARTGGLLRQGRDLYRVNQVQRYAVYGAGFEVNRIETLSPTAFTEALVARSLPSPAAGPELGTHHLSSNGRWTVSDHLAYARLKL